MNKKLIALASLALVAAFAFAAWKNGTFSTKESKADERGYIAEMKITVKGGLISKIDYSEAKGGKSKWQDSAYNASMKKVSGVSWAEAVQALENDLMKKQDVDKLDVVSGATELTARFKGLAAEALAKAK